VTLLKDIKLDTNFQGFYLIKSAETRVTRAGKTYLALTIQDKTGTLSGNLWDAQAPNVDKFTAGRVVHIKGKKELYNGMPQMNGLTLRLPEANEPHDPADFRPGSPVKEADLRQYFQDLVFKIDNHVWNRIVRYALEKYDREFFSFPAAKTNHHAYPQGLAFHTMTMAQLAEKVVEVYPAINPSLLYAGVIMHDLAKVLEFTQAENAAYTVKGNLLGHIVMDDEIISDAVRDLGIDPDREEVIVLRHMVLSHHGQLEYGSPVRPRILEAEVLHMIDNMDATVTMMMTALSQVGPGEFTQRVFALDNRNLYKPNYPKSTEE
jgi:3'-5' exoribonuclease